MTSYATKLIEITENNVETGHVQNSLQFSLKKAIE
jgi:hypothetical protein